VRAHPAIQVVLAALALTGCVIAVGLVDYATGSELAFSIFYFFPVGIAAWYLGWGAGAVISIESALAWYLADTLARPEPYPHPFIPAWNAGVRLMTFLTITVLLARLRQALERESRNARIDSLTGAANSRAFYEEADLQLYGLQRYSRPFAVLYLDVDNLKALNDRKGHSSGDEALKATVSTLRQSLRLVDTVARLGGDEFAVLLSEVDESTAMLVASRLQSILRQTVGTKHQVTFSMGIVACSTPGCTVDELIRSADDLMYEAKRGGKDSIRGPSVQDAS
jgi:diguanylate cyclase (GGDEF)-like protein